VSGNTFSICIINAVYGKFNIYLISQKKSHWQTDRQTICVEQYKEAKRENCINSGEKTRKIDIG
jgi:hypothetical protein